MTIFMMLVITVIIGIIASANEIVEALWQDEEHTMYVGKASLSVPGKKAMVSKLRSAWYPPLTLAIIMIMLLP